MYLVFINSLNKNFRGEHLYEFLFSESLEVSEPDNWYDKSMNEVADPPDPDDISQVGILRIEDENNALELAQYSKHFDLADVKDTIIPLGYEIENDSENRLVFHYGAEKSYIEDLLYKRDFHLEYIT